MPIGLSLIRKASAKNKIS